jgi:hypothetical protein
MYVCVYVCMNAFAYLLSCVYVIQWHKKWFSRVCLLPFAYVCTTFECIEIFFSNFQRFKSIVYSFRILIFFLNWLTILFEFRLKLVYAYFLCVWFCLRFRNLLGSFLSFRVRDCLLSICLSICLSVFLCVCLCLSSRMYVCMYVCMCPAVCMYVCMYVYTRTHIQIIHTCSRIACVAREIHTCARICINTLRKEHWCMWFLGTKKEATDFHCISSLPVYIYTQMYTYIHIYYRHTNTYMHIFSLYLFLHMCASWTFNLHKDAFITLKTRTL